MIKRGRIILLIVTCLLVVMIALKGGNSHAIDTSNIQVVSIKKITTEGYYGAPKWSPDGAKIYVPFYDKSQKKGGWVIMNPDGSGKQVRWDEFPYDFSPDKTKYTYEDDERYLGIANADGSNPRRIPNVPRYATEPKWSPDGNKIAFQLSEQIYTVATDGSDLQEIYNFKGKGTLWDIAWSPDGKSIAAGLNVKSQWKKINTDKGITIYTVAGEQIWSPDGKKIYSSDGGIRIFDTTTLSVSGDLQSVKESATYFDINFNKGLIAYILTEDYIDPQTGKPDSHVGAYNVWIMDVNGTGQRKITTGQNLERMYIAISPDGRYIAFNADERRSKTKNIYVIELSYQ